MSKQPDQTTMIQQSMLKILIPTKEAIAQNKV